MRRSGQARARAPTKDDANVDLEFKQMLNAVHEYRPQRHDGLEPQATDKPQATDEPQATERSGPTRTTLGQGDGQGGGHDDASKTLYSPYNAKNNEITLSEVQSILTHYGAPTMVRNLTLYRRAFVHKSYVKRPAQHNESHHVQLASRPDECAPLHTKSNERLEFVGDGVLECITKMYLYKRFPKEDEGFMTEKKIALVKNEHIGKLALDMKLNRWFVMSRHAEEKNTRYNVKKLGCLFEAFLGALFLDFNGLAIHDDDRLFDDVFLTGPGFQVAQIFLERIFDEHVDWSSIIHVHDNYKNILQVQIQKTFKVTPHYIIHDSTSQFEMGVYIVLGDPGSLSPENATPFKQHGTCASVLDHYRRTGWAFIYMAKGAHSIKKKAEQIACKKAIEMLDGSPSQKFLPILYTEAGSPA